MEDKTLIKTMLFDFYGDLLTEKQREYFDLYHNEDLSLSEIAERAGISRQGVYDIITRAGNSLAEIEDKTNLVYRWQETRAQLGRAESIARDIQRLSGGESRIYELAESLVQILEGLKLEGLK